MRLSTEKVKEAILHPDQDARTAAVYYFAQSFSPDPTVMPLIIQAIDRYGWREAFATCDFMENLVQTDQTVVWLIEQLERMGQPKSFEEAEPILACLACLSKAADPSLLQAHQERILALAALDDETRYAIEDWIEFPSRPPSELWQELQETSREFDSDGAFCNEEVDSAFRLVEALARHPDQFAEKVLAIVSGATGDRDTWVEILAVRLAGAMKLEAAVPHIIPKLSDADDSLDDECRRALVKIGTDAVIDQLARVYPMADWNLRSAAPILLRDIHCDLSVQTSVNLLQAEEDVELQALFHEAILLNFDRAGIEPARQYILNTPLDPDVLDVRSTLLTACKLMGQTFPEFDAWLEDSKNDEEFKEKWYEDHPSSDDEGDWDDEFKEDYEDDGDEEPYEEDEPYAEDDYEEAPPLQPIVFEEPRIGRNDPCPCGSGKKYKKCCYNNAPIKDEIDLSNAPALSDVPFRQPVKYPIGTVALYGPDDKTTTKIAAGVIRWDGAEPIIERWVGTNVKDNPKVKRQMEQFFKKHGVKSIGISDGNMGCPHEEGPDFPHGEDCPFCPFWKGKQGSARRD